MYADYTFYTDTFYGDKIPEEKFPKYATAASDFIDYFTMGKAANNSDLPAVKKCCCALAEQYMFIDTVREAASAKVTADGIIASESVGSHSRSFQTGAAGAQAVEAEEKKLADIARVYLLQTGLLYRGGVTCVHATCCNDL